mmetsp:Transcript_6517/g.12676  ORF Transcript_6517/g.12676 Transcript_6517/m.12676 type:complete len:398 (+) Transcript_6517:270-1463(+)
MISSNTVLLLLGIVATLISVPAAGQIAIPVPASGVSSADATKDLDKARTRWYSLNVTDYDYRYSMSCECLDSVSTPKNVQVRDGTIQSVEYAYNFDPSADPTVPPEAIDSIQTVPELFDTIQAAIDGGASKINVQYDRNYGHPTSVRIDYDETMADEEFNARTDALIDIRVTETRQTELDAARTVWDSFRVVDYDYSYRRSCFCMYNYTKKMFVEVRNNTVDAAYFAEDGTAAPDNMIRNWLKTIDGMFDTIQDAVDRKAHSMQIAYNETYGYPMSVSIDYVEMMADEELYETTEGLVILATSAVAVDAMDVPMCEGPDGTMYAPGDSYPAADGCNTCFCENDGSAGCTEMACVSEGGSSVSSKVTASSDASRGCGGAAPTLMAVLSGVVCLIALRQ